MKKLFFSILATTLLFTFVQTANANYDPGGIKDGAKIPAIELKDQTGKPQTFKTLTGDRGLVLFFIRSADWCPYCKLQMMDLQNRADEFEKVGYNVAAVSYDPASRIKAFTNRYKIEFPMLSDKGSRLINDFGILNTSIKENSDWYGIPNPVIYVIDKDAMIQTRVAEKSFRDRPPLDYVLDQIKKIIYLSE